MRTYLRRHYRWLILLLVVILVLVVGLGDQRVVAYTFSGSGSARISAAGAKVSQSYTNKIALFDDSVVHSIQVLISDKDYQAMITTYRTTGVKDWFQADVVIDGVRVNQVGVRLKGNASLRTALGTGLAGRGGMLQPPGEGFAAPWGFEPPEGFNPREGRQLPEGFAPPAEGVPQFEWRQPGGARQFPGEVQPAQPQAPEAETSLALDVKVPMLIKFDQFVEGQRYQGLTAVAVRTYGTSQDEAMLNEPLTNDVFRKMGQVASRTAYAGVRINDQPEKLFSIAEQINQTYIDTYFPGSSGILYKAEMGASLNYLGEDPTAYMRFYNQQGEIEATDMAPLIAFTRFLAEADEALFEADLHKYFDVDSFATYLAINNLLVNVDSLADMGNNFYIFYNRSTQKIQILYWDGNESLGKLGNRGSGQAAQYDLYYQSLSGMGTRTKTNVLKQRFLANQTFRKMYEEKLAQVYRQVFASGYLTGRMETYASLVRQANAERALVNLAAYDRAVEKVRLFIEQRAAYVASSGLVE